MRKLVAPLKKDRSRAHPPAFLWILLGIFGGLETLGLIGLFLGPVIMAAVMAIWREGCDAAKPHPAGS